MLTDAIVKLRECSAVKLFRAFIRSPWYLALIAVLMAAAELFALELPVMYIYLTFAIVIFLFDEDLLGIVPLFTCHYLCISYVNNPGKHAETLFSDPSRMVQLVILGSVYGVMILARLISLLLLGGKRKLPELTFGIVFFSVALVLGGAFSGYWGKRTVLFGLLEMACFFVIYIVFLYAVNWEHVPKDYGLAHLVTVGMGLVAEIIGMYFNPDAFTGTSVNRAAFYTGWGIYNNVGGVMAMCLPAPFYFALKRKEGWIYSLIGIVFYLAVLLTQSRGAMLFGSIVFLACIIVVLVGSKGWERWKNLIAYGGFALVALISILVFRERIELLFQSVSDAGWDDSLRFDTYRACWKRFLEAPWFGSGFYHTPGTVLQVETGMWTTMDGIVEVTGFMPPRAHNTLFQLLASGGVIMTLGYSVHRVQTGFLFYRHPTAVKTFLSFCAAALLLTSLLDCHLFNFGPGLIYSIILLFAEGDNKRRGIRSVYSCPDVFRGVKKLCRRCSRKNTK